MKHFASPEFWKCYKALPGPVHGHADRCFALLKKDPQHPSLDFKKDRCKPATPAKDLLAEFWRPEKEAEKMLEGLASPGNQPVHR